MARQRYPVAVVPTGQASERRYAQRQSIDFGKDISFGTDADLDGVPEPGNMLGNWVKAEFTQPGGTATFSHNLGVQATSATTPNVAWEIVCFQHDGTGAPAAGTHGGALCLVYEGGTVTSNSIVLALRTAGTRTIDGTHPVTVLVFFAPVGNW